MDQKIIPKIDWAGRVRTLRERQDNIVAKWKSRGVSTMCFAKAIGVNYQTLPAWSDKHYGV